MVSLHLVLLGIEFVIVVLPFWGGYFLEYIVTVRLGPRFRGDDEMYDYSVC